MYSGAAEVVLDPQGRLVIPSNLRAYAGLGKSVTVIGAGDHIEIWNLETWEQRLEKN
ncbi:MAG: hypothetical protein KatS3mg101_0719 [Patescibacteria group bacterium]|nr:MAG: hypothetical protein KatS3mg101_0719 [Patescibacteria group bacterium]